MKTSNAFCHRLRAAAATAKLSDEQVKTLLGISNRTLAMWLSGKTVPHGLTQEAALNRIAPVVAPSSAPVAPVGEAQAPHKAMRSGLDIDRLPHAQQRTPPPNPTTSISHSTSRPVYGRQIMEDNASRHRHNPRGV